MTFQESEGGGKAVIRLEIGGPCLRGPATRDPRLLHVTYAGSRSVELEPLSRILDSLSNIHIVTSDFRPFTCSTSATATAVPYSPRSCPSTPSSSSFIPV